MTYYSLWEVILNGNKVLKKKVGETEQEYEATTAEEKQDKRNKIKARGTLLMALPNKDQLKFHSSKDAKLLIEAIEKRYGGNKESKKVQRNLLKQQYKNFTGSSSKIIDQTFNRNKVDIETISLDDLYNNLKIYEPKLTGSSSTSQNQQNVAFLSSNSTNSNNNTNKANNTAYGVSTAHTEEQIDPDDLKEMDLQWEIAMLTIKARRFIREQAGKCRLPRNQENRGRENGRRTVIVETPTENALIAQDGTEGYDWSYQAKEEHPTNFTLMAYTSSGSSSSLDSEKFQNSSKSLNNLLESQVSDKFKTRLGYNAASSTTASPIVESFVNSSEILENQEYNKSKSEKGYHVVPPLYTGNFIPSKPDLMFVDEIVESENVDVITVVTPSDVKKVKPNHEFVDKGDVVEPKIVIRPVWNNSSRVNHKNFANKITHPHLKRRIVPQAVLTRSGKLNTAGAEVKTVRLVNTTDSKPTVNHPRLISNAFKRGYSQVTRPFNKATHNRRSTKKKEYKCFLTEYEDYDGGFVSFGDGKGRISGKVLSSDFKLLAESQVLLRVLRKDNIYSVDLKSVVPTKGLTCLFAKATIDESNL
ncbi:hypothetical protein Tco_0591542 [Tanacetum coccineum]